MKKNIFLLLLTIGLFSFLACEKEAPTAILSTKVTPNSIDALSASYVLTLDDAAKSFATFNWSAPDFGIKTAIRYILQADVQGNSFKKAFEVLSTQSLTTGSITVGSLNDKLLAAGLDYDVSKTIEFRVASIVNSKVDTVYSTVINTKITPYATTFPPIYMDGDALQGWGLDKFIEIRSTAPSVYYTIAQLTNGKIFRFFKNIDWAVSYNYNYFTTVDADLALNPGDGDNNFKVVGATGYYEFTINLKLKTVVVTPIAQPEMYMTGDAFVFPDGGSWNWTTDFIKMDWKSYGMYEATATFKSGAFRFFAQAGWSTSYNYPYFAGGTVSPLFENANDGDKNFKYIGTQGKYKITLNMLDKIVTMTAAK
jgi:starch-binding outer membrane protein SusE/F